MEVHFKIKNVQIYKIEQKEINDHEWEIKDSNKTKSFGISEYIGNQPDVNRKSQTNIKVRNKYGDMTSLTMTKISGNENGSVSNTNKPKEGMTYENNLSRTNNVMKDTNDDDVFSTDPNIHHEWVISENNGRITDPTRHHEWVISVNNGRIIDTDNVICEKRFETQMAIDQHNSQIHREENITGRTVVFRCPLCTKDYNNEADCKHQARLIHVPYDPFQCYRCGKVFKNRDYLHRHIKEIHEYIKYKHCPKTFRNSIHFSKLLQTIHRYT